MIETLALDDMGLGGVFSRRELGIELDSAFQILSFGSTGYLKLLPNSQIPNMLLLSFTKFIGFVSINLFLWICFYEFFSLSLILRGPLFLLFHGNKGT